KASKCHQQAMLIDCCKNEAPLTASIRVRRSAGQPTGLPILQKSAPNSVQGNACMNATHLGGLDAAIVRRTLLDAADLAATRTLPHFRTQLVVDNKWSEGFDPVTAADRDAEQAI